MSNLDPLNSLHNSNLSSLYLASATYNFSTSIENIFNSINNNKSSLNCVSFLHTNNLFSVKRGIDKIAYQHKDYMTPCIQYPATYRVIIKYCVFFLNSASSAAALVQA